MALRVLGTAVLGELAELAALGVVRGECRGRRDQGRKPQYRPPVVSRTAETFDAGRRPSKDAMPPIARCRQRCSVIILAPGLRIPAAVASE
jgi:hypothetical protein